MTIISLLSEFRRICHDHLFKVRFLPSELRKTVVK